MYKKDIQQLTRDKIEIGIKEFINYLNDYEDLGLALTDKNNEGFEIVTVQYIKKTLDLTTIHTINYLKIKNAIEIIFKNGCTSYVYGI